MSGITKGIHSENLRNCRTGFRRYLGGLLCGRRGKSKKLYELQSGRLW